MKITVASGKGGTGKTTVAVNLAVLAARRGGRVRLGDCDVEEPNTYLFLEPEFDAVQPVTVPVPVVDHDRCQHCGACAEICQFNAIASLPAKTMVFPDLCHSCSGCWLVCPQQAITPSPRPLGEMAVGRAGTLEVIEGRLKVGETLVPPLIRTIKDEPADGMWCIFDAPPGTSCPVVETIQDTDFVILVTEPTPFGLHDLALALELSRRLEVPAGVVVNRAGPDESVIDAFCEREGVPVLARIPFRRAVAAACAEGGLALDADLEVARALEGLYESIETREVPA